jgi:uncharacterized Zn-finger protein
MGSRRVRKKEGAFIEKCPTKLPFLLKIDKKKNAFYHTNRYNKPFYALDFKTPEPKVTERKQVQANAAPRYEVTRADLPLSCPMPNMTSWNSHPRVFLPIEEKGYAKCIYCGAEYILKDYANPHFTHKK